MVVQLQQYSIQFYWTLNSIPSIHYYPTVLPGNPYTLLPPGEYYPHGLREVQGILAGISRYRCVYRATTLSYSLYCTTYTLLYPYIPTSPGGSPPSTNQGRYGCISRSRVGRDSIEGQSLAGMHVIQYPHPLLLTIPYQGTPTSLFLGVVGSTGSIVLYSGSTWYFSGRIPVPLPPTTPQYPCLPRNVPPSIGYLTQAHHPTGGVLPLQMQGHSQVYRVQVVYPGYVQVGIELGKQ